MFGIIYALLFGVAATRNVCYDINEKETAKKNNEDTYYDSHGVQRHILTNHRVMTTRDFNKGTYILKDLDTGKTIKTICYDRETQDKIEQKQLRIKQEEENKRNKEEAIKNRKKSYMGYGYVYNLFHKKEYTSCKKRVSDDLPITTNTDIRGFFMSDLRTDLILYSYYPEKTTKQNIKNAIKYNNNILKRDDNLCESFYGMTNKELREYAKKIKAPLTEEEFLCKED